MKLQLVVAGVGLGLAALTACGSDPILPVAECSAQSEPVQLGNTVVLNGQLSFVPGGGVPTMHQWSVTARPEGDTTTEVNNPTLPTANFTPQMLGDYSVQLVVTDAEGVESEPCGLDFQVIPLPVPCADGTVSTAYASGECPRGPLLGFVTADFGFDADLGDVRSYTSENIEENGVPQRGELVNPTFNINLLFEDQNEDCTITLTTDITFRRATWIGDIDDTITVWNGFEMPSRSDVTTDCTADQFSEDPWTDDPINYIAGQQWGFALTEIDGELEDALINFVGGQAVYDADWAPYVMGGAWRHSGAQTAGLTAGLTNETYALAWEVDDNWNIVFDDDNDDGNRNDDEEREVLDAPTGGLSSGAYRVFGGFAFDASCLHGDPACLTARRRAAARMLGQD